MHLLHDMPAPLIEVCCKATIALPEAGILSTRLSVGMRSGFCGGTLALWMCWHGARLSWQVGPDRKVR